MPGFKAAARPAAMDLDKLAAHSKFFDHLVDLVPAKYYLDGGQETVRRGGQREGGSRHLGRRRSGSCTRRRLFASLLPCTAPCLAKTTCGQTNLYCRSI